MTLTAFLSACTEVVKWLFGTVFGLIAVALTQNPITLSFIVISLIGVVCMIILDILLTAVGQ